MATSPSQQQSPLYTPGIGPTDQNIRQPKLSLSDMLEHSQNFVADTQRTSIMMPTDSDASPQDTKHGILLKFVLTGLASGVLAPGVVIRMCPPLTTKNLNFYQPLLAVGKIYLYFINYYQDWIYILGDLEAESNVGALVIMQIYILWK